MNYDWKLDFFVYTSFRIMHYNAVIMGAMVSQITSLTIVYSTIYSRCWSKKTSKLRVPGFVRRIHRSPVNSPHKGPVTQKMFPFDDVIMYTRLLIVFYFICSIVYHLSSRHADGSDLPSDLLHSLLGPSRFLSYSQVAATDLDTRGLNLRVPDLQMSCCELT